MKPNTILQGDALTKLKELPDKSINMCMTSPPYWALRDYGIEGQLGLEPTFDLYIKRLCDIFDEVKRVLRDDGTIWVNLGDTYSATRWTGEGKGQPMNKMKDGHRDINPEKITGLPDKCLTLIPFRFAIEMVNRGWILRNVIIWHKPNCMPSSVKDRFTVDFEYIFFFSKKKKYYFETQYEPSQYEGRFERRKYGWKGSKDYPDNANVPPKLEKVGERLCPDMRNKRCVWTISPKPFKEAHFAVYPEELCETPIKAGCHEFVCVKCGNPKVLDLEIKSGKGVGKHYDGNRPDGMVFEGRDRKSEKINHGYKPTCSCNAEFTSGIVLDPFFGAGTTGLVALKQNKKFIGIELNPEYIEIAKKRLKPHLEQMKLQ